MSNLQWYVFSDCPGKGITIQYCKTKAEAVTINNRLKKHVHPIIYGMYCGIDKIFKSEITVNTFSFTHGSSVKQVDDILAHFGITD